MAKSLIDIAFDYLKGKKGKVPFAELWEHVKKESGLSEEVANNKVGQFYTNLRLDGRFHCLVDTNNNLVYWDLKSRYTFDATAIDSNAFYESDDDSDNDSEEENDDLI